MWRLFRGSNAARLSRRSNAARLSLGLVLVLVACGGRTLGEDLGAAGSGPTATGAGPGAAGGGAGADPGAPTDPAPPPTGGAGGGTGGGGGGGGTGGGSTPSPAPRIACGSTSCDAATQDCCVTFQPAAQTCVSKGQCQSGLTLSCSSAASCPSGQVCCLAFDGTSTSAKCQTSCGGGGPGPGGGARQLCASDRECGDGARCEQTPLGFRTCVRRRR